MDRHLVYQEIKWLKHELIEKRNEVNSFSDPVLVDVSQRLDEKLNQYQRLSQLVAVD